MSLVFLYIFFSFFVFSSSYTSEKVFTEIYSQGIWHKNAQGLGTSGTGSCYENAIPYIDFLNMAIKHFNIRSIVDLGCGDWEISRHIDLNNIEYNGLDIVKSVIDNNIHNYSRNNITFLHIDCVEKPLPKGDLLICKDVLQHLSYESINKILRQFCNFKYVLLVNDISLDNKTINYDIKDGGHRPLDLEKEPFFLKPYLTFRYQAAHHIKKVILIENPD